MKYDYTSVVHWPIPVGILDKEYEGGFHTYETLCNIRREHTPPLFAEKIEDVTCKRCLHYLKLRGEIK